MSIIFSFLFSFLIFVYQCRILFVAQFLVRMWFAFLQCLLHFFACLLSSSFLCYCFLPDYSFPCPGDWIEGLTYVKEAFSYWSTSPAYAKNFKLDFCLVESSRHSPFASLSNNLSIWSARSLCCCLWFISLTSRFHSCPATGQTGFCVCLYRKWFFRHNVPTIWSRMPACSPKPTFQLPQLSAWEFRININPRSSDIFQGTQHSL